MPEVGDEIIFERLTRREDQLGNVYDALEAKASSLLTFDAILMALLPAVFAEKAIIYWGKYHMLGSITLIISLLFASLAGAAIIWVLAAGHYRNEDTSNLPSWRNDYVSKNSGASSEELTDAIRTALIDQAAERIKKNERLNKKKQRRLQLAYYCITVSGVLTLLHLIAFSLHQF